MVPFLAVPEPAAAVAAGGGDPASRQLERDLVGDADGPRAAADGEIAAGVDEAGADDGEELGDAVDGVALADPAEVEAGAGLQLDRRARRRERAPPQRGGGSPADRGRVRSHGVERAVVARGHDGVVDGRVEPAAGRLAGLERELDDPHEVGARGGDPAVAVEARELGVVTEARHHLLEPLELRLRPVERAFGALAGLGVEQQLDVGAHRPERSAAASRRPRDRERRQVDDADARALRPTATPMRGRLRRPGATAPAPRRPVPWRPRSARCGPSAPCGRRPCGWSTTCWTSFASARSRCSRCESAASRGSGFAVAHGFAATAAQLTKKTTTAMTTA